MSAKAESGQLKDVIEAKRALAREFDGEIARLEEHLLAEQERHRKEGRIRYEAYEPTPLDAVK